MASVNVVLRKDKRKPDGTAPLYFRIIKHRKTSYISSGIYILEKHWDDDKKRVRTSYPNSARLNHLLTTKLAELQGEVIAIETTTKSMTSRGLKDKIYGKAPSDFISFADEVTEGYKTNGSIGTYDKNRSILQKFRDYVKGSITFEEITYPFILKYEKHLKEAHGNAVNTVSRDLKYVKKLFNDAHKQGIIEPTVNPFLQYQFKLDKTSKTVLTEDQVAAIENLAYGLDTPIDLHRDMFVFCCYTGLRVSDVLQLRWLNFDGTNINITIKKTKEQLSIKVPDAGVDILMKYLDYMEYEDSLIFPMLDKEIDFDDPEAIDHAISGATAYINKNLKVIAKDAKIAETLTFHVSRHTFATRALRYGVAVELVQKLMGHANIRETMGYTKIVNAELEKAMDKFNK